MNAFKSIQVSQIPAVRDAMQANLLFLNDLIASEDSDQTKVNRFADYFGNMA